MSKTSKNSNAPYCAPPEEFNGVTLHWLPDQIDKFMGFQKRSKQETMLANMDSELIEPADEIQKDLEFPEDIKDSNNFNWLKIFLVIFHSITHCIETYCHTAFRSKHMTLFWLKRNKCADTVLWKQIAVMAQTCYKGGLTKKPDILRRCDMLLQQPSVTVEPQPLELTMCELFPGANNLNGTQSSATSTDLVEHQIDQEQDPWDQFTLDFSFDHSNF